MVGQFEEHTAAKKLEALLEHTLSICLGIEFTNNIFKKTRAETAPAMATRSVIFSLFQPIPAIWSYLEQFGFF